MILVTGATGTIGRELVNILVNQGTPLRALVRRREKAEAFEQLGVEVVEGDLADPKSLEAGFRDAEKLFLLSPPDPHQTTLQSNALRAAARAGIGTIVKISAMGAASDSPVQLGRWHAETERQLERSKIPFTILRPHSFMQNLLKQAPSITANGTFYACAGDGKIAVVDARDVAAVAAVVLTSPGHEGETYELTGPQALSFAEMAEQLSHALGREVRYADLPPNDARTGMIQQGLPEWLADDLVTMYTIYAAGHGARVTDAIEAITGQPARDFRTFAEDYAAAFQATE